MNTTIIQTLSVMLIAMLFLAIFNSASLQTWSYDLEPGPVNDLISANADWWHGVMEEVGAAAVTQSIRDWFSEWTGAF